MKPSEDGSILIPSEQFMIEVEKALHKQLKEATPPNMEINISNMEWVAEGIKVWINYGVGKK